MMGAWAYSVMGNDSAMDYEGDMIVDICGISMEDYFVYFDMGRSQFDLRPILETHINELVQYVTEQDDEIATQVLGAMLIRFGCSFSTDVKQLIIKSIENDKWQLIAAERKLVMEDFMNRVIEYDTNGGVPVEVPYTSLFATILAS